MRHCFHVVDFTVRDPSEACCWCDQPRREPLRPHPDQAKHGPYLNPMTLPGAFLDRTDADCPDRPSV